MLVGANLSEEELAVGVSRLMAQAGQSDPEKPLDYKSFEKAMTKAPLGTSLALDFSTLPTSDF